MINKAREKSEVLSYEKPEVLAQNEEQGSFAASCPEENSHICRSCEEVM